MGATKQASRWTLRGARGVGQRVSPPRRHCRCCRRLCCTLWAQSAAHATSCPDGMACTCGFRRRTDRAPRRRRPQARTMLHLLPTGVASPEPVRAQQRQGRQSRLLSRQHCFRHRASAKATSARLLRAHHQSQSSLRESRRPPSQHVAWQATLAGDQRRMP